MKNRFLQKNSYIALFLSITYAPILALIAIWFASPTATVFFIACITTADYIYLLIAMAAKDEPNYRNAEKYTVFYLTLSQMSLCSMVATALIFESLQRTSQAPIACLVFSFVIFLPSMLCAINEIGIVYRKMY